MATQHGARVGQKMGWAGGVNLLTDPKAVRDDQLTNGKNCWPTVEGILAKRQAVLFERFIAVDTNVRRPLGMFIPDPVTGFDIIVHYADDNGAEYIRACRPTDAIAGTGSVEVKISSAPKNNYQPISFCNYRGQVIACGGGLEGFYKLCKPTTGLVTTYNFEGDVTGTLGPDWIWLPCSFNWDNVNGWFGGDLVGTAPVQPQATPIKPQVCAVYSGNLYFANFGPGMESWIIQADASSDWAWVPAQAAMVAGALGGAVNDVIVFPLESQVGADVLASNGRHIELPMIQGQSIRAMLEVSSHQLTQGLGNALLVLTERSCVIVTGQVAETTDTGTTYSSYLGDWVPAKVNFDCGCAGPYAITNSPVGTFWANGDDVYALYTGVPQPVLLGTNIRPALQECPPALQPFWHMTYAGGAVYLAIATADSEDERHLVVNHWRLDTRPVPGAGRGQVGPEIQPTTPDDARWWGPQDYSGVSSIDAVSSLGCCIATKRATPKNSEIVYGLWWGNVNSNGNDQGLCLVSFNQAFAGRDVPYREAITGRQWTANELVAIGDLVMPTPWARSGRVFCAIGPLGVLPMVTGNAEPSWPTDGVSEVTDGQVLWAEITRNEALYRAPNTDATATPGDIAMEPDFKEYDLGLQPQDKLLRRADLTAFFSTKQQAWLDILGNGGQLKMQAGPCVIGDFTLGRTATYNDLGLLQLDFSSLAQEFQARQLRPSDSSRNKLNSVVPGIVRARTLQPRFRAGSGFVIDSTNDHLVYSSGNYDDANLGNQVFQAVVVQGYYDTINDVLAAIATAMTAAGLPALHGATTVSSVNAFLATRPYMCALRLSFASGSINNQMWYLMSAFDPTESITYQGQTLYVNRSMRLMSMLGFDTTSAYSIQVGTFFNADNAVLIPVLGPNQIVPGAGPTVNSQDVIASQAVPYTNSPVISITDLRAEFIVKPGRPLALTGRQS